MRVDGLRLHVAVQRAVNMGNGRLGTDLHRGAVAAMPANEKSDPVQVNFFSAQAIVQVTNPLPDLVEQADGLQRRTAGFHGSFYNWINKQCIAAKPNRQAPLKRFL